jgi:L-lactate dehydrogenase complex protein LldF
LIPKTKSFKKDLPKHLQNQVMRRNISRAAWHSLEKRAELVAKIPNWEEMRKKAHQIKREVINRLSENLDTFETNARQRGIKVFRAKDAREANRLAEEIARRHGVKCIVKSKSMVTEEVGFNDYMIGKGFEVVETDLGEYIIQLAREAPSHLTAPAIHKSRVEIAQLFHEKLGTPYSEDPEELTGIAREVLREKFLSADMGVTGANFGIIESGAITIVENEGNARMCATVPPVHVAFVGIERLLPRAADLSLFLPLLCCSATAQRLTSFVSLVDGPRSPDVYDGPEHVYYILVDNRRSSFLEDEHLRQALYCIRCGACYNTCPVYQNIGGHAYGWVYQGPIGAVITPQFLGLPEAKYLPFASSLCGSCTDICPVKIPLHHLLLYQRQRVVKQHISSKMENVAVGAFARLACFPGIFSIASRIGRKFQHILPSKTIFMGWSKSREVPQIARKSFREWWKEQGKNG